MFAGFFYLLRSRGLEVSLNEWITLLEGMSLGLHHASLTGFYQLCRAVLVKSEADFDRFDQVFLEYFKDVPYDGELPGELLEWLNHPAEDLGRTLEELRRRGAQDEQLQELLALLEQRLREQTEEHNGGSYWVGTQGRSPFGNSGWHPGGIRIGGESRRHTAVSVAGERKYRDFRQGQHAGYPPVSNGVPPAAAVGPSRRRRGRRCWMWRGRSAIPATMPAR